MFPLHSFSSGSHSWILAAPPSNFWFLFLFFFLIVVWWCISPALGLVLASRVNYRSCSVSSLTLQLVCTSMTDHSVFFLQHHLTQVTESQCRSVVAAAVVLLKLAGLILASNLSASGKAKNHQSENTYLFSLYTNLKKIVVQMQGHDLQEFHFQDFFCVRLGLRSRITFCNSDYSPIIFSLVFKEICVFIWCYIVLQHTSVLQDERALWDRLSCKHTSSYERINNS